MTELLNGLDTPSDAELISRVRGGDVAAYGVLFSRHRDAANRLARQLIRGPDADDLTSEAFAKVLGVLQRGGGPDVSFRAYLLTAVRRLHVDRVRSGKRLQTTDDLTPFDPGVPFQDTTVAAFENAAAAKAFASLPERWQLVLWHLEVEGQKPADIAPLLGMSANSVSALAYRAREGLRQAFLTMHLSDISETECRWVNEHLGGFVRKGLSQRDTTRVKAHLDGCRRCTAMYLELTEVNSNLSAIIAPLLLGTAATGYLASINGAGGALGALSLVGRVKELAAANTGGVVAGAVTLGVATAAAVTIAMTQSGDKPSIVADPPAASTSTPAAPLGSPQVTPTRRPTPTGEPTAAASTPAVRSTSGTTPTPGAGATPSATSPATGGPPGVLSGALPGLPSLSLVPVDPAGQPGQSSGRPNDPGGQPSGAPTPGTTGVPSPGSPAPGTPGAPSPTTTGTPSPGVTAAPSPGTPGAPSPGSPAPTTPGSPAPTTPGSPPPTTPSAPAPPARIVDAPTGSNQGSVTVTAHDLRAVDTLGVTMLSLDTTFAADPPAGCRVVLPRRVECDLTGAVGDYTVTLPLEFPAAMVEDRLQVTATVVGVPTATASGSWTFQPTRTPSFDFEAPVVAPTSRHRLLDEEDLYDFTTTAALPARVQGLVYRVDSGVDFRPADAGPCTVSPAGSTMTCDTVRDGDPVDIPLRATGLAAVSEVGLSVAPLLTFDDPRPGDETTTLVLRPGVDLALADLDPAVQSRPVDDVHTVVTRLSGLRESSTQVTYRLSGEAVFVCAGAQECSDSSKALTLDRPGAGASPLRVRVADALEVTPTVVTAEAGAEYVELDTTDNSVRVRLAPDVTLDSLALAPVQPRGKGLVRVRAHVSGVPRSAGRLRIGVAGNGQRPAHLVRGHGGADGEGGVSCTVGGSTGTVSGSGRFATCTGLASATRGTFFVDMLMVRVPGPVTFEVLVVGADEDGRTTNNSGTLAIPQRIRPR